MTDLMLESVASDCSSALTARQESCTNFGSALEGLGERESRTRSVLRDENVLSCRESE